ncbi:MAG: SdpI family protein [Oscillospiraceae bacterium]
MKKKFDFIYWFFAIVPFIMSACFYNKLPEQVAVHFDANWVANGYQSRLFAAFGLPAILLAVAVLVHFAVKADPKHKNIERSKGALFVSKWFIVIIANFVQASVILNAVATIKFNMSIIMGVVVGILLAVIGNYLPKCKQNYTVGIKVPWTLSDEENWTKTHRLAGYIWTVCGIIFAITAFFPNPIINISLFTIMIVVPIAYSFILYLNKKKV